MPTATVTSKGQITIPVEVREAMGLKPGAKVMFFPNAEGDFVMRVRVGSIMDLRGCLAGFDVPKTDEEMNELLHQRAFELDEATKSGAAQASKGEAA
jgi:AbrB family looped-hinge helix DNA binding protein